MRTLFNTILIAALIICYSFIGCSNAQSIPGAPELPGRGGMPGMPEWPSLLAVEHPAEQRDNLLRSGKLVAVMYTASWCGYCTRMKPQVKLISKITGYDVVYWDVDIYGTPKGIFGVPYLDIYHKDGSFDIREDRFGGYMNAGQMQKLFTDRSK